MQSLQLVKFLETSENSINLKVAWEAIFVSISASIAIPLNKKAVICWVGWGRMTLQEDLQGLHMSLLHKKFWGDAQTFQTRTDEKDLLQDRLSSPLVIR